MHFPDEYIQYVKDNNPLFDVITDFVEMKKEGSLWVGKCPFHADGKTPSFKYYESDGGAYCYGCNRSFGDSIDFIMELENLKFPEAVEYLIERAHLDYPNQNISKEFEQRKNFRNMLHEKSREFWFNLMRVPENQHVLNYLFNKRQLTEEDINKWRLGYCDFRYINRTDPEAEQFKKFTNRITFSILDHKGEIVGFSSRVLPEKENQYAKYINSSEKNNPLFKKKNIIYGLNYAKKAISKMGYACWVEGFFDVIAMHKIGMENTVASMGTSITEEQVKLINRFTDRIFLFMDPDSAGEESMQKSLELFSKYDIELKLIQGISGLDPDETVKKLGESFQSWLFSNAKTIEQYYVDKFLGEYSNKVNDAKRIMIKNLKTIFKNRLDHIETEIALGAICNAIDVNVDTLKHMIKK